jgi:hypothetical protein
MRIILQAIVPNTDGFFKVKSNGRVYSRYVNRKNEKSNKWHELKPSKSGFGYPRIWIKLDGEWQKIPVHTVVLISFRGPRPKGKEARHYPDNDPSNNNLGNLSWASRKINQRDRKFHGTVNSKKGEDHPQARLNDWSVRKIRNLYKRGKYKYRDIDRLFGLPYGRSWEIVNAGLWNHI